MKYKPSNEGFFDWLFGKKKDTKKQEQQEESYIPYSIPDYAVDEMKEKLSQLDDSEVESFLNKKLSNTFKPQYILQSYRQFVSKIFDVTFKQLIPKWQVMEKFHWHSNDTNPVDDNGNIKIPALEKALHDAGKVAQTIVSKPEFNRLVDWTNDHGAKTSGTLKELGYDKKTVVDMVKFACDLLDERKNAFQEGIWYCIAEDHTDGWNYVANHIFQDYYDDPGKWPDLQAGEKVFLTVNVAFDILSKELGKFLLAFGKHFQVAIR